MRKSFNTYIILWAIALILFNLVIFVIPSSINGKQIIDVVRVASSIKGGIDNIDKQLLELANYLLNSSDKELILNKYGGAFWPCYVCITFAFIGQLICAFYAFKEDNNQKFFYKIPLIRISYLGLCGILVSGVLGMFIPDFPIWIAVTICIVIFVITLVSLLKANFVGNVVSDMDDKILKQTAFIKDMTTKAKDLWDKNKSNEDLRKLYETSKYANPKFEDEELKLEILNKFNKLNKNVDANLIKEIIELIK